MLLFFDIAPSERSNNFELSGTAKSIRLISKNKILPSSETQVTMAVKPILRKVSRERFQEISCLKN